MKAKISWKKFLLSLRIGILSRIPIIFNESRKKVGIQKKCMPGSNFFYFFPSVSGYGFLCARGSVLESRIIERRATSHERRIKD